MLINDERCCELSKRRELSRNDERWREMLRVVEMVLSSWSWKSCHLGYLLESFKMKRLFASLQDDSISSPMRSFESYEIFQDDVYFRVHEILSSSSLRSILLSSSSLRSILLSSSSLRPILLSSSSLRSILLSSSSLLSRSWDHSSPWGFK
jgi:hypothetical protein